MPAISEDGGPAFPVGEEGAVSEALPGAGLVSPASAVTTAAGAPDLALPSITNGTSARVSTLPDAGVDIVGAHRIGAGLHAFLDRHAEGAVLGGLDGRHRRLIQVDADVGARLGLAGDEEATGVVGLDGLDLRIGPRRARLLGDGGGRRGMRAGRGIGDSAGPAAFRDWTVGSGAAVAPAWAA